MANDVVASSGRRLLPGVCLERTRKKQEMAKTAFSFSWGERSSLLKIREWWYILKNKGLYVGWEAWGRNYPWQPSASWSEGVARNTDFRGRNPRVLSAAWDIATPSGLHKTWWGQMWSSVSYFFWYKENILALQQHCPLKPPCVYRSQILCHPWIEERRGREKVATGLCTIGLIHSSKPFLTEIWSSENWLKHSCE